MEPYSAIRSGSFEDFKTSLDENPDFDWKHFFLRAFRNQDLTGRVEIVNWMLDHGADPAHVKRGEGINALHVLFTQREHDFVGEARLLQRLLDGGADINLKAPKWSVPIQTIIDEMIASDDEVAPFYDVIFSYPGIDWDVIADRAFGEPISLRRSVELSAKQCPELYRRMCDYMENGPSPRPVFD